MSRPTEQLPKYDQALPRKSSAKVLGFTLGQAEGKEGTGGRLGSTSEACASPWPSVKAPSAKEASTN